MDYAKKREGKLQKIDEMKIENCYQIENITIESDFIDIVVVVSNDLTIKSHLYGEVDIDGHVSFNLNIIDKEIKLTADLDGISYTSNLKLLVSLPKKKIKKLGVKTFVGKIMMGKEIFADEAEIKTRAGEVTCKSQKSSNFKISTMSGDIKIWNMKKLNISTMSGEVSFLDCKATVKKLQCKGATNYFVAMNPNEIVTDVDTKIDISTMSGDITVYSEGDAINSEISTMSRKIRIS